MQHTPATKGACSLIKERRVLRRVLDQSLAPPREIFPIAHVTSLESTFSALRKASKNRAELTEQIRGYTDYPFRQPRLRPRHMCWGMLRLRKELDNSLLTRSGRCSAYFPADPLPNISIICQRIASSGV